MGEEDLWSSLRGGDNGCHRCAWEDLRSTLPLLQKQSTTPRVTSPPRRRPVLSPLTVRSGDGCRGSTDRWSAPSPASHRGTNGQPSLPSYGEDDGSLSPCSGKWRQGGAGSDLLSPPSSPYGFQRSHSHRRWRHLGSSLSNPSDSQEESPSKTAGTTEASGKDLRSRRCRYRYRLNLDSLDPPSRFVPTGSSYYQSQVSSRESTRGDVGTGTDNCSMISWNVRRLALEEENAARKAEEQVRGYRKRERMGQRESVVAIAIRVVSGAIIRTMQWGGVGPALHKRGVTTG